MSFQLLQSSDIPRVKLRSKECIDTFLKPLTDNIKIKINDSLICKDLFHTAVCMAVDKGSVHSISKNYQKVVCETSIRHHFQKLDLDQLVRINDKFILQETLKILKKDKEYEFAIDFTNDPYYGEIDSSNENYVIRS